MIKKALMLMGIACAASGAAHAQFCATDEVNNRYLRQHPEIALYNQQLERDIAANIQQLKSTVMMRGTADTDTAFLTIPVVVHIIHDYGTEYLSDDKVYQMMDELNTVYSKQNLSQLSQVINTFVPYIGNMHIRFRLATKDPGGNPTHGITRSRTYLTAGGDDQAKLDFWPQNEYLNIWFERVIGLGATGGGIVAAYSMTPGSAQFAPEYDGLIANYQFINSTGSGSNTVPHEIGHFLNLSHPWGNTNSAGVSCGDDNVDDTPPTKGHFGGCDVYDVTCATNYTHNGIDYPDTTNVQNIMDYADCELMFTKGQTQRSRAALRSGVANRSNLWTASNLTTTGALANRPSLPPVADFSATRMFGCAGSTNFSFVNRSWNDTLTGASWTFSNSAGTASSTSSNASTTFSDPGWVTATLTATGNSGSNTISKQIVYAADPNAINAHEYYAEFTPGGDIDKYPVFNYYNTERKWELVSNAGVYDNYSIRYVNQDTRAQNTVAIATNTPKGDYSDFYTPAFDLSTSEFAASSAKLTFFTAGAYRTASTTQMNDVLDVSYSTDCGNIWRKLDTLAGVEIANNTAQTADFTPQGFSAWTLRSFALPALAKGPKVYFRFRYKPGVNSSTLMGNGNNFYVDRIGITSNPLGINEQELNAEGIALAPNPTTGNAWIMLSNKNAGTAQVLVTDITGKAVYKTSQAINGTTRIEIPATAIPAKGMYLVQVQTNSQTYTKKLVVY